MTIENQNTEAPDLEFKEETPTEAEAQTPEQLRKAYERQRDGRAKDREGMLDMAFELAGVDITDGFGKKLRGSYEGEATKAGVLAEVAEWGLGEAAATPPAKLTTEQAAVEAAAETVDAVRSSATPIGETMTAQEKMDEHTAVAFAANEEQNPLASEQAILGAMSVAAAQLVELSDK